MSRAHGRAVSSNKTGTAAGDRADEYGRRSIDNCCTLFWPRNFRSLRASSSPEFRSGALRDAFTYLANSAHDFRAGCRPHRIFDHIQSGRSDGFAGDPPCRQAAWLSTNIERQDRKSARLNGRLWNIGTRVHSSQGIEDRAATLEMRRVEVMANSP